MGEKVRENRLRRTAGRQGLRLEKSRRRDPHAIDFGMYWLINARTNALAIHSPLGIHDLTLDDVEAWLTQPPPPMLGHGRADRQSAQLRQVVHDAAHASRAGNVGRPS
jgi:hypothetical protein